MDVDFSNNQFKSAEHFMKVKKERETIQSSKLCDVTTKEKEEQLKQITEKEDESEEAAE